MIPGTFGSPALPGSRASIGRLRTCDKCQRLREPEGGIDINGKWACAACGRRLLSPSSRKKPQ